MPLELLQILLKEIRETIAQEGSMLVAGVPPALEGFDSASCDETFRFLRRERLASARIRMAYSKTDWFYAIICGASRKNLRQEMARLQRQVRNRIELLDAIGE